MDIRIECPTARGSGTSVARLPEGGTAVVTNFHVIDGQSRIVLHSGTGQTAEGRVLVVDPANDLALVGINQRWPIVRLGDDVAPGEPVQFRAYDNGRRFRKYYGHVTGSYAAPGAADGWLASGRSVPGNSGGGVYRRGRLVGVVWGNPEGGTAFVRLAPVRRLIGRVAPPAQGANQPPADQRTPNEPAEPACDCHDRWRALEGMLQQFRQSPGGPPLSADWPWWIAAALAAGGPIGMAAFAVAWLLSRRAQRPRRKSVDCPPTAAEPERHRYVWDSAQQRAVPVAVESPPREPVVMETNRYVPYETPRFQAAYRWAAEQVARKFPAAVDTLQTLDRLIEQQLNASGE